MLLRDLLDDPLLGLELLTGQEHLDRPVRGVYITDLIDPRRYLSGGELVLSGLVWHSGPADSEQFAAALADAGIAGLAAGTARLGSTPSDLVSACRRHEVPVLEVPVDVSFNALSERVLRAERRDLMARRELVAAVASGAELESVLAMAARELGADCWVLSGAGWRAGEGLLDEESQRLLVRSFLGAKRLPITVDTPDGPCALWPVGSDTEVRAARWFAVARGDHQEWTPEQEAVAVDLGTAAALLRARLDEGLAVTGRSVAAALSSLLDGSANPPEVAARLQTAGLPAGQPLRVTVLRTSERGSAAVTLLREIAAATEVASVTAPLEQGTLGEGALAVFAGDREQLDGLDTRLRRTATQIEPGLGRLTATLGVSDVCAATDLRRAVEEASYARRLAEHRPGPIGLVTGAELASHQALLASIPDDLRRSYRDRLLSRLVEYDRAHHSDLLRTLEAFLESGGSWSRCAKQLHVHVNTLRYRIQRVEEITGRELSEFAVRVDFYLALKLDESRRP